MKFRIGIFVLFLLGIFLLPELSLAEGPSFPYWPSQNTPLISCTGDYANATSSGVKPCTSLCDVIYTFRNILYFAVTLVILGAAPILFFSGGLMILLAGASPNLVTKGRQIMWSTFIGVVITLSAYLILATFLWAIGNPKEGDVVILEDGTATPAQRVSWPEIKCDSSKIPGGEVINQDEFNNRATVSESCNSKQCPSGQVCLVENGLAVCKAPPP